LRRVHVGVFAAGLCTFINLYSTQALLPTLAQQFGASLPRTGLTVTATLIAVALVAPFVGGISDALGRRRLILGASLALAAPTLLAAWAPGLDWLILCRFVQGLLLPFIFAVTVAYIAEECPGAEAVRVTGVYAVGTIVGGFAGRFIAGWATELAGWRSAFLILAALTLACAGVIAGALPAEQRFRPVRGWRGQWDGFADQFGNPQVMATCAVGFAVLFSMVATFTYANFYLGAPPFSLGPAQLGSVFVVYLLGVVAAPVATRLALRFGRRRTVLLAAAAGSGGLLLTLAPWLPGIVLGLAFAAAGIFTEQVLSLGYVAAAARRSRSTAVGLYVTCYYVGGSLGGVLPASIWHHLGWPGCVALVLAVQGAATLVTQAAWPAHAPSAAA
jgi:YNFM family putative membrane transporter